MTSKQHGRIAAVVAIAITVAPSDSAAIAKTTPFTGLAQASLNTRFVRRCHAAIREQIRDDFAEVKTVNLPVNQGSVKEVMIAAAEKNVRGSGTFFAQGYWLRFSYSCVFNTLGNFVSRASYQLAEPLPDRMQGR